MTHDYQWLTIAIVEVHVGETTSTMIMSRREFWPCHATSPPWKRTVQGYITESKMKDLHPFMPVSWQETLWFSTGLLGFAVRIVGDSSEFGHVPFGNCRFTGNEEHHNKLLDDSFWDTMCIQRTCNWNEISTRMNWSNELDINTLNTIGRFVEYYRSVWMFSLNISISGDVSLNKRTTCFLDSFDMCLLVFSGPWF